MSELSWMKPKKVLIKKVGETNPNNGCDPFKRDIKTHLDFGIVNIDKPSGPSSHQVASYVQRILKVDKAGHSGTLDPKVTGVLPVALGRGTRIVQSILTAGKEYMCLMQIHQEVPEEKVRKVIEGFVGEIDQLPPVRSAVKRQLRKRTIYYIDILEIKDKHVLFRAGTQAGTYIRKLCSDIGLKLGCGAHMQELRRTRAGPFGEDTICTMQELTDAYHYYTEDKNDSYLRKVIKPIEMGAGHLAKVWIHDSTIYTLCHGAFLNIPGISKLEELEAGEKVAVLSLKGELVCVGTAILNSQQVMKQEKGLFLKPDQVFMLPETYPKMGKE